MDCSTYAYAHMATCTMFAVQLHLIMSSAEEASCLPTGAVSPFVGPFVGPFDDFD